MGLAGTPAANAASGAQLWVDRYSGPGKSTDVATSVSVSPDGARIYVAGGFYGWVVAAYDATTGAKEWIQSGPTGAEAISVVADPDGSRVFVAGQQFAGSDYNWAVTAYDAASGVKLWTRSYDGPGHADDRVNGAAASPDGSQVVVTGSTWVGSGQGYDLATVSYDATTGQKAWTSRYNGPGNAADDGRAVSFDATGDRVYVTGETLRQGLNDYVTLAYDGATGVPAWASLYDGAAGSDDSASSVAVSPDGTRVFVTGSSYGSGTYYDYATLAYDAAAGTQLWEARYDGPVHNSDHANALAVNPDGTRVLVTGDSWGADGFGGSSEDFATLAYDATSGTQEWEQRFNGPGDNQDDGYAIAVAPDGSKFFVTGDSFSLPSKQDYVTIAYDVASGTNLWTERYNGLGSGPDIPTAIVATPDGARVAVTGSSFASITGTDFATVAYDA